MEKITKGKTVRPKIETAETKAVDLKETAEVIDVEVKAVEEVAEPVTESAAAEAAVETAEAATDAAKDAPEAVTEEKTEKKKKTLVGPLLTLWQIVKFSFVSIIATVIQTTLQLVLPLIFDGVVTPLPQWLRFIYNVDVLFDVTTADGLADYVKYVVDGTVTWGYVLSFFLANITANVIAFFLNKKYTFKSSAPNWHFWAYFVIMVLTIVFTTWVQGVTYGFLGGLGVSGALNRLICLIPASLIQAIVFFVAQKLLLPPDKTEEDLKAEAEAKAKKEAKKAAKKAAKESK